MTAFRRRRKAFKRYVVYLLARALTSLVFLLPTRLALGLGAAIGRLGGRLARPLARRARAQLQARLGVSAEAASRLTGEVFANVGRVGTEIVLLPRLRRDLKAYVGIGAEDRATLDAAVGEGKGVLVVTAHLGNWELLAQRLAAEGYACTTLARRSPNPYLGAWLVRRRAEGGLQTLNRGGADTIRGMLAAVRQGALLGVLIDQDTAVDSVHVPFFGRPAATPVAASSFAVRRGLPVVACFVRRRPSGGHTLTIQRVPLPDGEAPKPRAEALTADLTARIETAIRASPGEWVWFHDRWRTPPALQAETSAGETPESSASLG